MKYLTLIFSALSLCFVCTATLHAQESLTQGMDIASERERIKTERSQMESEYSNSLRACYQKIHVNNCKDEAFKIRLQKTNLLRAQERVLNDQERKKRSAAALQSIEDKNSLESQTESAERRARSSQQHLDKLESNLEKNQDRLDKEAREALNLEKNAQREKELTERQRAHAEKVEAARIEREKYLQKLQSAQEHREQVERNRVQRGSPGAALLPSRPLDKP
jgi:colicin import membrane protein